MNIKIKNLRDDKYEGLPYQIKVDRTSVLGNPFVMLYDTKENRNDVCDKYKKYFEENKETLYAEELSRIKSIYKVYNYIELFCWCAPKRCHAQTIALELEITLMFEPCRVSIIGSRQFFANEAQIDFLKSKIPDDTIITSGNAVGADQISKHWERNIQYLPWSGYNSELGLGMMHIVAGNVTVYDEIIDDLFPWIKRSGKQGLLKLIRRNMCMVSGLNNDAEVDAVYYGCMTDEVSGGTAYAVTYAKSLGIPCYKIPKM